MLNRRTLRIKAMQSLFAYKHYREANYNLALKQLQDFFSPNLNSMELQDKKLLKAQSKEAIKLFQKYFKSKNNTVLEGSIVEINEEVNRTISYYYTILERDQRQVQKEMLKGVDQLLGYYAWHLNLLVVLARELNNLPHKKNTPPFYNFINNRIIKMLQKNKKIERIKNHYSWERYPNDIKDWAKNILAPNEKFNTYLNIQNPTFDQDKEIIYYLVKTIFFKDETINSFFEMIDLGWSENKPILRSLMTKTIKNIEDNKPFELLELSYNWQEDLIFFKTIYNKTLDEEEQYEKIISIKSKNWDISRIASIDMVMLEMAIQEMIHFPSIPIKVTINEYVEISKKYSTPKSRQFINGILDVIAVDLQESGLIKKSGRGLIDNK